MGAKQQLLDDYLKYMGGIPHNIYLEPCAGMGNIVLNYFTNAERVINDYNINNALLFKVLASTDYDVSKHFLDNLENAAYNEDIFNSAYESYKKLILKNKVFENFEGDELADIGAALYVMFRTSYGGKITGKYKKPDKYSDITNFDKCLYDLSDIMERLRGTKVKNMDAVKLIEDYKDRDDVFMFLDPPYLPDDSNDETSKRSKNADKVYECRIDYTKLLPLLCESRNKIMLCNYNNKLLLETLVGNGWKQVEIGRKYIGAGMKKNDKFRASSVEYIYVNFNLNLCA